LDIELPGEWLEKARFFHEEAKRHYNEGVYWYTCYTAHQAVEFYLKAFILALTGLHPFTHDLVELLDAIKDLGYDVPEELYTYADALTPHYTMARYPGRKPVRYNKDLGRRCLIYAEKIISWVEEKASKTHDVQEDK